jgi:hypothetical protein
VQIEKEEKLKKTLNQRTFLIFNWVWIWMYGKYILLGLKKKLKTIFGGRTGKTEPQV